MPTSRTTSRTQSLTISPFFYALQRSRICTVAVFFALLFIMAMFVKLFIYLLFLALYPPLCICCVSHWHSIITIFFLSNLLFIFILPCVGKTYSFAIFDLRVSSCELQMCMAFGVIKLHYSFYQYLFCCNPISILEFSD